MKVIKMFRVRETRSLDGMQSARRRDANSEEEDQEKRWKLSAQLGPQEPEFVAKMTRKVVHAPTSSQPPGFSDANQNGMMVTGGGVSRRLQPQAEFGFCLLTNLREKPMEDFVLAEFREVEGREVGLFAVFDSHGGGEVGLFAVFDSHGGGEVGRALQQLLFENILAQDGMWADPAGATRDGYLVTDRLILERWPGGPGGGSAVTGMLLEGGRRLVVGNVGDSRAVLSRGEGEVVQLTVEHVPSEAVEKASVEMRGGVVSTLPGDISRVEGRLGLARSFGDGPFKKYLTAKPDIFDTAVFSACELVVMGSNGLWATVHNQECVDLARRTLRSASPEVAATQLAVLAQDRGSNDDISCLVISFGPKPA